MYLWHFAVPPLPMSCCRRLTSPSYVRLWLRGGFRKGAPRCTGGTLTSPLNKSVICLLEEKHDSFSQCKLHQAHCSFISAPRWNLWLPLCGCSSDMWLICLVFFLLWLMMKVSACHSKSSVLHRMWRRRLLYTLFYAGLSKEASATGVFLGQGSSSCAKTLLKWCSTVSR